MPKSILAAFDFDGTLIDENSDLVPLDLLPGLQEKVKALSGQVQWTDLMGQALHELWEAGVKRRAILERLAAVVMPPGIKALLRGLKREGACIIIISDANTVYIDAILKANGVYDTITEVFTNPATWTTEGRLEVRRFDPTPRAQECGNACAVNMCKGRILREYLMGKGTFSGPKRPQIIYVGDGRNDYCPVALILDGTRGLDEGSGEDILIENKKKDGVFARTGYALARLLSDDPALPSAHAHIGFWSNGTELCGQVESLLGVSMTE